MNPRLANVLTLNAGSSSLKFSIFSPLNEDDADWSGSFERIGQQSGHLQIKDQGGATLVEEALPLPDHLAAMKRLLKWLESQPAMHSVDSIGHRIVHGGPSYTNPTLVDASLLEELRRISPFDSDHLPAEIGVIEAAQKAFPDTPNVACFDTAFHRTMPKSSQLLALPRRFAEQGIVRYGFHGLSYEYICEAIRQRNGSLPRHLIVAHLGGGCSMAAIKDGKAFDTTMGFTPTGGLIMGTRSGDLDPGLVLYLMQEHGFSAEDFNHMVNKESGLLGLSGGLSSDMRDLLELEIEDSRANEAVESFCYTARKFIGAFAAGMGGFDALVFTAGIGEHSPQIRDRICQGLQVLGVEIAPSANLANADTISTDSSRVQVLVEPTNEELMIAKHTRHVIGNQSEQKRPTTISA